MSKDPPSNSARHLRLRCCRFLCKFHQYSDPFQTMLWYLTFYVYQYPYSSAVKKIWPRIGPILYKEFLISGKRDLNRTFITVSINKWYIINHLCSFDLAFKFILGSLSPGHQPEYTCSTFTVYPGLLMEFSFGNRIDPRILQSQTSRC